MLYTNFFSFYTDFYYDHNGNDHDSTLFALFIYQNVNDLLKVPVLLH